MKIKVKIARTSSEEIIEISKKTRVIDILKQLNVKPDTCIPLINGKPVPIDITFEDNQILSIIEVSSGG